MWEQFIVQNIHYVLEVFVAFIMVTAAWIYLDGWLLERKIKTLLRATGFFVLTSWALVGAVPEELFSFTRFVDLIGVAGFVLVFASLFIDPVPVKPGEKPVRFFSRFWAEHFGFFPAGVGAFSEVTDRLRDAFSKTVFLVPQFAGGALWLFTD